MKQDKRTIIYMIWIVLGVILLALSNGGIVEELWGNIGAALMVVSVLQLFRNHRINKNVEYREKMEINQSDERMRYIRSQAWAWAGYTFILVGAVGVLVLKAMGQDLLSTAASFAVCFMLVLYWAAYFILKRKY